MGQIIQTLALAMVLLIVGLSCVVIGVAGLALLARRDRRRIDTVSRCCYSSTRAPSSHWYSSRQVTVTVVRS
jgi:hypothetical protein